MELANLTYMVETISACERRITISIEATEVAYTRETKLHDLACTKPLNGFRKGSVAAKNFIAREYQPEIEDQVYQALIPASLNLLLETECLNPVSEPVFSEVKIGQSGSLDYAVKFETYPSLPPLQLDQILLEKKEVSLTEADIDQVLSQLSKQGQEIEEGNQRKQAHEWISLNLEQIQRKQLKTQLFEQLLETNPVKDLPKQMVERCYLQLKKEAIDRKTREMEKNPKEEVPLLSEADITLLEQEARKQVTLIILFNTYAARSNIQLDTERMKKMISTLETLFSKNPKRLQSLLGNQQVLATLQAQVMEEQIVDTLMQQVNYRISNSTYAEMTGLPNPYPLNTEHSSHE